LFFMSVGMTANIGLLLDHPLRIIGLALALMIVKALLLWGVARVTHHSAEASRGLAFALPQAGEFGFVLFSLGVSYGLLEQSLADELVIVVTVSMIASPFFMLIQSNLIEPRFPKAVRPFDEIKTDGSRVLIAGFGRFGQIVGRILTMRKIQFTALEASVDQVDFVRRFGNRVYYGDASRLELLQAAGAEHAELFVLAIDDIEASVRTVEVVRKHFPHLKILARARNRQHAIRLMDLGIRYIIRETYLSSLDMAQKALETLGMPHHEAVESIRRFDEHDKRRLRVQREIGGDEQKLIQSARDAAKELESLFEADEGSPEAERKSA
jgi:voltage-gated potassium channel Kch